MMRGKITIFIPAYNEERTVGSVVLLAKKYGNVIVIDDGSIDRTAEIARKAGASVIARKKNGGYGAAHKTALAAARDMNANAFVFMDADGQHDANEIPVIVTPLLEDRADICQGSRFLGKFVSAPFGRREGVAFINKLSSVQNGKNEIDAQCGFRAVSKKAIGIVKVEHDGFAGGSEIIQSALSHGLRVVEVPVHVKYFSEKNNPFAQGAGLVDYFTGIMIRKNPLALFGGVGTGLIAISALIGVFVVDTFYTRHELATGSAFLTVFIGIAGMIISTSEHLLAH